MKIKWLDTSCFLITSSAATRIITDPFFHLFQPSNPPEGMGIRAGVEEYADIITITHGHFDHSYVHAVKGVPRLYTGGASLDFKGISLKGVTTWHDNYGGAGRGTNSVICMQVDGIWLCHMGDYGQERLTDEQLAQIGRVDILLTPWDTDSYSFPLLTDLNPSVVIPMHHSTVDQVKHLKGFVDLSSETSELEFKIEQLPREMKVYMLQKSLAS